MTISSNQSDPTTHTEQSIPYEWRAVEHADETLVIHDVPEWTAECYRVAGSTRNNRALAFVDAALYEGTIVEPFYDETTRRVLLQHAYAGTKARLSPEEWLEDPVVVLERCDRVDLEQQLAERAGGRDE